MATNCLRKGLPKELLRRVVRVSHVTKEPSYLSIKEIISSIKKPTDCSVHIIYKNYLRAVLNREIKSYSKNKGIHLHVDM